MIDLNKYKAFIFDFDGTLVDSLGLWQQIDIIYLKRFGFEVPDGLGDEINGMSFTETAQYFKDRFNLPLSIEHIKQDWVDLSHDYYMESIDFQPGAREFLNYLKNNHKKIGIATSNQAFTTERYFRKQGIDYIGSFAYSCDVEKGKPFPFVFLKAAEDLGVKPEECLAFEDTLEGVTAAKRAGMTVVAFEDKYSHLKKEEIKELADYYITDYGELLEYGSNI